MLNKNQVYGNAGESAALAFLKKKKYKILEKNFRTIYGEIDIIARQKKTYVFVEVKTRASRGFGEPSDAVNRTKQRHIIHAAESYLDQNRFFDVDYRFDIIEVVGDKHDFEINHIEDAFA